MTQRKRKPAAGLAGKLMLSGALILGSGAYARWQRAEEGGPQFAARQPNAQLAKPALKAVANSEESTPPLPPQSAPDLSTDDATLQAAPPPLSEPEKEAQVQPPSAPAVAENTPPTQPAPPVALASNTPTEPAPSPATPPQPAGRYLNGDFTGPSTDTPWGTVQVKVHVQSGAIAEVDPIDYPQHRRRSIQINERALPILEREVIQAQSSDVDIVSQATTTSVGYLQSLTAALAQAKK